MDRLLKRTKSNSSKEGNITKANNSSSGDEGSRKSIICVVGKYHKQTIFTIGKLFQYYLLFIINKQCNKRFYYNHTNYLIIFTILNKRKTWRWTI